MAKRGSKTAKKQTLWSKTKAKYSSFYKKRKKTTVLLTIGVAVLAWCMLVVFFDFVQFKSVEPRVNTIKNAMTETLGTPKSESNGGYCAHASSKFQKGRLSCFYEFEITYKYSTDEEAQTKLKQFNEVLAQKKGMATTKSIDHSRELKYERWGGGISYDLHDWTPQLDCGIYLSLVDDWTGEIVGHTASGKAIYNKIIIVSGSCSKGDMFRPVYPVKD